MKFKSSLSDWIGRNVWVHYTEEPYVKIHVKPIHNDMAGIYLFPESFKPGGNWPNYPYKIYVEVDKNSSILDLSKFSFQDMVDVLNYIGVEVNEETLRQSSSPLRWFWDRLRSKFSTKQGEWNRLFRDLGYDAIFDDTGTIFFGEVQLVVLNPRIIKVLDIERQFKTGFKEAEKVISWLENICSEYSNNVKSSPLKKKSNDNYVSLVSNIHVGDDNKYVWWKVYVPRMTGRYEVKKYAPQEIHISLALDSEGVTSRMGRGARIGIGLNREDFEKAEKEVRSVMEEVFVKSKEKAAFKIEEEYLEEDENENEEKENRIPKSLEEVNQIIEDNPSHGDLVEISWFLDSFFKKNGFYTHSKIKHAQTGTIYLSFYLDVPCGHVLGLNDCNSCFGDGDCEGGLEEIKIRISDHQTTYESEDFSISPFDMDAKRVFEILKKIKNGVVIFHNGEFLK